MTAVQLLRSDGRLPNIRYQWRDRPHTTRAILKSTLKYMQEGQDLIDAFIVGEKSFCRRVKNSSVFRNCWLEEQRENRTISLRRG